MAHKIRVLLDERQRLPAWLARETNISENTIYHIMKKSDDIDKLHYGTVRKIAAALDCEIEDLRSD